jgi:hypothetical protein
MKRCWLIAVLLCGLHARCWAAPDSAAVADTAAAPQVNAAAPSAALPPMLPMPSLRQKLALPLDFRDISLGMYNEWQRDDLSSFNKMYEQARLQMFPKPTDLDRAFGYLGAAGMATMWGMVLKQAVWGKNFHHVEIKAGSATPAGGTSAPHTPPAGHGIPPVKKR